MHIDLWTITGGRNRLMAVIRVENGVVKIEEKEPVPPLILQDIDDHRRRSGNDDARFLRMLEAELTGSYYRAILKQ